MSVAVEIANGKDREIRTLWRGPTGPGSSEEPSFPRLGAAIGMLFTRAIGRSGDSGACSTKAPSRSFVGS